MTSAPTKSSRTSQAWAFNALRANRRSWRRPQPRRIMDSAIACGRHTPSRAILAAREMERCTSLISCSRSIRAPSTVVPTSTQKPVDVSEGDRLYTRIRKQQQNAGFAKKFLLASGQRPELSQPTHLSPATDPRRAEPRERIGSDPRTRINQYDSSQ